MVFSRNIHEFSENVSENINEWPYEMIIDFLMWMHMNMVEKS